MSMLVLNHPWLCLLVLSSSSCPAFKQFKILSKYGGEGSRVCANGIHGVCCVCAEVG